MQDRISDSISALLACEELSPEEDNCAAGATAVASSLPAPSIRSALCTSSDQRRDASLRVPATDATWASDGGAGEGRDGVQEGHDQESEVYGDRVDKLRVQSDALGEQREQLRGQQGEMCMQGATAESLVELRGALVDSEGEMTSLDGAFSFLEDEGGMEVDYQFAPQSYYYDGGGSAHQWHAWGDAGVRHVGQ